MTTRTQVEIAVDLMIQDPDTFDAVLAARGLKPIDCKIGDLGVGDVVFFRTVRYHTVGKILKCTPFGVKLENPELIRNTGTWNEAVDNGIADARPFRTQDGNNTPLWITRDSIVDFFEWPHKELRDCPNTGIKRYVLGGDS